MWELYTYMGSQKKTGLWCHSVISLIYRGGWDFWKIIEGGESRFSFKNGRGSSYKEVVYKRGGQALLFTSVYVFCSNNTSFIKLIFLLISEILIISNQKMDSNLYTMGSELSSFFWCTLIQVSLKYSVSFIIMGSFSTNPSINFVTNIL